jgi:hypothetical protein
VDSPPSQSSQPAAMARPPTLRLAIAAAVLVLGFYGYFYQAGGWNQNSRFDLVRAIVERGTSSIDAYHTNTGDKAKRGDHYYCDKAPAASWLAVPAYAAIRAVAATGHRADRKFLAWSSYGVTVWAIGLPSAVAVGFLLLALGALGIREYAATGIALAYGLGTMALPYSTLFYGHQLAASLVSIGFSILVIARGREGDRRIRLSASGWFAVGALLGSAVAVEYPAALAGLVIAAYGVAFADKRSRLWWLIAGGAIPGLAVAAYHMAAFGGPLRLPYHFSTQKHRHMGGFMGIGLPTGEALWGILGSSYRGLFYGSPWLLAAIPGSILLVWKKATRGEACVCGAIALAFVWLNASLVDWQGGWAMGPRYLIPAVPFLAVAAGGVACAWGGWSAWVRVGCAFLLSAAATLSAALMLLGTAVKPEVPTHIARPFGDFLIPALAAGRLAVNTQSIDRITGARGGPPHAWNLGQQIGLEGFTSLAPLAGFAVIAALAIALCLRHRGRGEKSV